MKSWTEKTQSRTRAQDWEVRWDLLFFAALLIGLNWPLLAGAPSLAFVYWPDRVRAGEWWRLLAHPFVHLSWYHLLLDASAFFFLYTGLEEKRVLQRIGYVAACAGASLLISIWAAPDLEARGLCGLSGVAHGLAAVWSLELARCPQGVVRRTGVIIFALICIKAGAEAIQAHAVLLSMHLGNVGSPIAVCHAGGLLGAMTGWLLFHQSRPLPGRAVPGMPRLSWR